MDVHIFYTKWDEQKNSHALLQYAVSEYLKSRGGSCPRDLSVCRKTKFGKPYIKELPNVSFSISHSGQYWACAVAPFEIGIDLQEDRVRDSERMARRFYHPDEVRWLEKNGFEQFCRLWAYKESYVKYSGQGLIDGMDYFSAVSLEHNELGVEGVFQQQIPFLAGYWFVLTSAHDATYGLVEFCPEN